MLQLSNPVLERMKAGQAALGLSVRLSRSADIARLAKATNHDFLFIDGQHAIFNAETVAHLANAALAIGVAPIARVRGIGDPSTAMLLDNGVSGIVFPDINTPEEARRAVDICKFPPVGRRSAGANYPQFDCRSVPIGEAVKALNASTVVVCMIETKQALDNVEAIAAVPGVDVLHVGANDLLIDVGKPGAFDDPFISEALLRVYEACRKNGKYGGCGGIRDVKRQAAEIKRGARFLTTQSDVGLILAAATQWTAGIRKELAGG